MSGAIRVMLIDDQELVRTGFRLVLSTVSDIDVVAEAEDGAAALKLLRTGLEVDVCCMDIRMPRMNGIEATRAIVEEEHKTKVLVLTTFDHDQYVYEALATGASGFLLKDCGAHDLIAGIRTVASGNAILAPTATARLVERFRPHMEAPSPSARAEALSNDLSPREIEVLTAIGQGMSNQEIAASLFMAETTVKSYVGRLLTKLDARDRVHLVIIAYDAGLAVPKK